MLDRLYNLAGKVLFYGGILLTIFIIGELMRVAILISRFNRLAGYVACAILFLGGVAGIVWVVRKARTYPRMLSPPFIPDDLEQATHPEMRRYVTYLMKTCRRLSENQHLDSDDRKIAASRANYLAETLIAHPLLDDLIRAIDESENKVIFPLLDRLTILARQEVDECVHEVMTGVNLIPFESLDVLAILSRNGSMVVKIVDIFAERPRMHEQIFILRDAARVLLSTPFARLSRTLQEHLIKNLPDAPTACEPIGRSLSAGFFAMAAGAAAIERCAAIQGWDKDEATQSLMLQGPDFLKAIHTRFDQSVREELRLRLRAGLPEDKREDPAFWNELGIQTGRSIDATVQALPGIMVPPTIATSEPSTRTPHQPRTRSSSSGLGRSLRKLGHKVRYGFRRPY